jgi:hypothetical protein
MNESNLPLQLILDTAKKLNEIEEKLSDIYHTLNLTLKQTLENTKNFALLHEDTINTLASFSRELDIFKGRINTHET